ncbi:MAG: hypothetical protein CL946_06790 [Ectothiorhodospiraceae bacterium]|nr:hypothetical protein [Ectothiorhodospiraceae bacterium]
MKHLKQLLTYGFLVLFAVALTNVAALAQDEDESAGSGGDDEQEKLVRRNWSLFSESYKMHDYTTAKKYGWEVLELAPNRFKTLHGKMSTVYDSLRGRTDDPELQQVYADSAIWFLNEAIRLFPDKKDYYLKRRGILYDFRYDDKKAEAIADYEAGIDGDYINGEMWYVERLATLYSDDPDQKMKAVEVLQAILERDPNNAKAQTMIKNLITDPAEYVGILKNAYYSDPESAAKLYEVANGYFEMLQQYDSAAVYFEKLVTMEPQVKNYWERLATSYMFLSKYEKAIDAYTKVSELEPTDKKVWYDLARAQQEAGKLSAARTSAEKASEIDPAWGAPYMLVGQLYETSAQDCVTGTRGGWANMKIQDKAVYVLAQSVYRKAMNDTQFAEQARTRIGQLNSLTPSAEDLFRNGIAKGSSYSINSGCYGWIGRSVTLSY